MEKHPRMIPVPQPPQTFPYAGARADAVVIDSLLLAAAEKHARETGAPIVVPVDGARYRLSGSPNTPREDQYLIPHYERQGTAGGRKEELLRRSVERFFGIARKNISVARSCNELDRELTGFIDTYADIQRRAHQMGRPEFSLSTGYGEMTTPERKMVEGGSMLVGRIVNRLGRTGNVILHDGDTQGEGKLEDLSELILRWSDHPKEDLAEYQAGMHKPVRDELRKKLLIKDFRYWGDVLLKDLPQGRDPIFCYTNDGEKKTFPRSELIRCVVSHNQLRDHDGAQSYLAYEIYKHLTDIISIEKHEEMAEANPAKVTRYKKRDAQRILDKHEADTIGGMVNSIGFSCKAIDETYDALQNITESPDFRNFVASIHPDNEHIDNERHHVGQHRGMLRKYTEIARKRCSIDSRDATNFDQVALDCTHMNTELKWLHKEMRDGLRQLPTEQLGRGGKQRIHEALDLLERGISLIDSMASERIPRNHSAPEVYDKDKPQFRGRDASSVGRLSEKIDIWANITPSVARGR